MSILARVIKTRRLLIRRFNAADLDDFLAYQADPAVRRHQPGQPMTTAQAVDYLATQAMLDQHALDRWHGFAVETSDAGRVIGDIGVWLYAQPADIGDIGFQFHPGYHGRGLAREAMEAFLPYVFGTLGLHRLTAGCDPANTASRRLLERLGMHLVEGSAVQYELRREEVAPR